MPSGKAGKSAYSGNDAVHGQYMNIEIGWNDKMDFTD